MLKLLTFRPRSLLGTRTFSCSRFAPTRQCAVTDNLPTGSEPAPSVQSDADLEMLTTVADHHREREFKMSMSGYAPWLIALATFAIVLVFAYGNEAR